MSCGIVCFLLYKHRHGPPVSHSQLSCSPISFLLRVSLDLSPVLSSQSLYLFTHLKHIHHGTVFTAMHYYCGRFGLSFCAYYRGSHTCHYPKCCPSIQLFWISDAEWTRCATT